MPENKPFVINDRRKFTADGELRPDAVLEPAKEAPASPAAAEEHRADNVMPFEPRPASSAEAPARQPELVSAGPGERAGQPGDESPEESPDGLPPLPSAEEAAQVSRAYDATVDRLDTALRATDPGGERLPPMTFERVVQSLYMQALMQLGGAVEPGQPPRLDLIGSRQTIDMLSVLADKVKGNVSDAEDKLLESALFELRMGFLEVTQALARQAATRQPGAGAPGGPSIVR